MKQKKTLALMVAVLLLATALRFHRLELQSFWNDEGNSARLSERSLDLIIEGTASDIHPPLYYLLLRGWRELAGESEFGLRSFSVFVGIGVVGLTFALGRLLLGLSSRAAIISGVLLVAINPALVYYSQEARMYELLALLAVLSTWLLVRLLQKPGWPIGLAIAYIITATAGLYTHYFFPAVLLAQNLVLLVWIYLCYRDASVEGREDSEEGREKGLSLWGDLGRWALIMLAVFVLYLPWLPIFLRQAGSRSGDRTPILSYLLESGKWMTYGPTIKLEEIILPIIAYTLLFLSGLYLGRKRIRQGVPFALTLLLNLVISVALMWLVGSTQPAFFKFLLVAISPLCLLAGSGLWWLYSASNIRTLDIGWKIISVIMGVLLLLGTARSLYNMYYDTDYARADYRSMAARIAAEDHPKAAIVLNAPNQWEVFTYYHAEGAPVFPVPKGYPDPAVIDDELNNIAEKVDRIYALYWGEGLRDPQRLVERWLEENTFKAQEDWVGDVRFVTYGVTAGPAFEMKTPIKAGFGENIGLEGYTLISDQAVPGDILQLTLFWRTNEQLERRYKVFLHLVDEEGQIVAQRDSEPGGGLALTTTWRPGETVVDNHGVMVPVGTPLGTYRLLLGLYEISDPAARLPIELDGKSIDSLTLNSITVEGS